MQCQSKLVLCITWSGQARVMLSVVFEDFENVYIFFASLFFSLSLLTGKRSTLQKIWGGSCPPSPWFLQAFNQDPDGRESTSFR